MQTRRTTLLAPLALAACASPLPEAPIAASTPEALALLEESAAAHGLEAFRRIRDVSVSYAGDWAPIIGRLQPALVDPGFRGTSEERLLPREGIVAQAHAGPAGRKQVVRRSSDGATGEVRVWFNGEPAEDAERRAAAALVADGYALFLLGPMLLAGGWGAPRMAILGRDEDEAVTVGGRRWSCAVLRGRMIPGLGFSGAERIALFLDREERLMRRVRFGLEGMEGTRGAVAEVDAWGHVERQGVRWPTRFHERLLRPLPLAVHDWRLTGLDLDRGITAAEVEGPAFLGRAAAPAAVIPPPA
ncbi:hypothetical protein JMJ56_18115 [Belnapia sp. T18]|uniref:Outer membrane lipoprotein-sorting protein n=1 Tax=Belnapia arida TaxID=2804533 RepID=A0ABS1U5H7_9PROT|nr:hypothetical protein [Belnapia arida]MBL6079939.1 hypothetical protein [Belnapia arida]